MRGSYSARINAEDFYQFHGGIKTMAEMKNRGSVEGGKDFSSDEAHVRTQARVSKLTESRLDPQPRDADDELQRKASVLRNG